MPRQFNLSVDTSNGNNSSNLTRLYSIYPYILYYHLWTIRSFLDASQNRVKFMDSCVARTSNLGYQFLEWNNLLTVCLRFYMKRTHSKQNRSNLLVLCIALVAVRWPTLEATQRFHQPFGFEGIVLTRGSSVFTCPCPCPETPFQSTFSIFNFHLSCYKQTHSNRTDKFQLGYPPSNADLILVHNWVDSWMNVRKTGWKEEEVTEETLFDTEERGPHSGESAKMMRRCSPPKQKSSMFDIWFV